MALLEDLVVLDILLLLLSILFPHAASITSIIKLTTQKRIFFISIVLYLRELNAEIVDETAAIPELTAAECVLAAISSCKLLISS